MRQPTQRHTNRLLGYPDDARLLIINADDFGMCHAANAATTLSLTAGVVTSTTLFACLHNPEFLIRATAELWYVSLGQSGRQRRGTRRR